jgi:hypothetical protein
VSGHQNQNTENLTLNVLCPRLVYLSNSGSLQTNKKESESGLRNNPLTAHSYRECSILSRFQFFSLRLTAGELQHVYDCETNETSRAKDLSAIESYLQNISNPRKLTNNTTRDETGSAVWLDRTSRHFRCTVRKKHLRFLKKPSPRTTDLENESPPDSEDQKCTRGSSMPNAVPTVLAFKISYSLI